MAMFQVVKLAGLAMLAAGCRDSVFEPRPPELGMLVAVSDNRIRVGEATSFSIVLHNPGRTNLSLPGTSCVFRFELRKDEEILAVRSMPCRDQEDFFNYAPGESKSQSVQWFGRNSFERDTGVGLAAASYTIRGDFIHDGGRLTDAKQVTVHL